MSDTSVLHSAALQAILASGVIAALITTLGSYLNARRTDKRLLDIQAMQSKSDFGIQAMKTEAAQTTFRYTKIFGAIEDIYRNRFNSHVLAVAPYPPQVVFCNAEINGLDDLAGKKVRASGRMTAQFLEALGAEGVNVSFGEVPGALQNGVVDCAVTGAGSGYSAGWWEVSTHLLPIPLGGWDSVVTAMNMDKWNSLDADTQTLIMEQVEVEFEAPAWATAQNALANDVACLTGNGECASGEARSMTLVEVSDADFEKARGVLVDKVLPDWAERAGAP